MAKKKNKDFKRLHHYEIEITYTCPETGIKHTTGEYDVSGWESDPDSYTRDSGVDLTIYKCESCGKMHEASW
ncbi:MAG: hypothetical protein ACP5N7_00115 [Candidatus Pacearchaeota archaeon]